MAGRLRPWHRARLDEAEGAVDGGGTDHIGIASGARLADFRINGGIEALLDAIGWINNWNDQQLGCVGGESKHIDVVNLSLGTGDDDCGQSSVSSALANMFENGVVVVKAAGNSGPAAASLRAPNAESGVIHVANADDRGTVGRSDDYLHDDWPGLTRGSSRGPRCSDGDADSNDELIPTIAAPGTAITRPTTSDPKDGSLCTNCFIESTGTSYAAPHVAGIVALMLQIKPCLRPLDRFDTRVRDILINTSEYRTEVQHEPLQHTETGLFGRTWNNGWGYGYVNAYEAVRVASETSC
jgi:subtilisin family serine protease